MNFVKKIKNYFGDQVDIFGAGFTDHVYDKNATLDSYKYSIILETIEVPEYFSEKLADCYLTHTFPIYHGCSNLSKYINSKSFERINMHNFESSVSTIKGILDSVNLYKSRLDYIIKAKMKYLNNYSMFPVIISILY